mgnify:CR=1 FL=1
MINQKRFLNKIASFNYKFMFMNLAIATLIMSPILDLMFTYSINLDTFSTKWTIFICLIAILTNLRNIKINKVKIFFVIFILIFYVSSSFFLKQHGVTTIAIILWCLLPLFIVDFKYDVEKILRYCLYYATLLVFSFNRIMTETQVPTIRFSQVELYVSYSLVIIGTALIFHFVYYRNKATKLVKVLYLLQTFYLISYIGRIARGSLLVIIVSIFACMIGRYKGEERIKTQMRLFLFIFLAIILFIFVSENIEKIIYILNNTVQRFGIDVGAINKSLYFFNKGNISNGRNDFFQIALDYFKQKPIIGNGIGTFTNKNMYGIAFVHNFILQFLYEGGIILTIPILILVFKAVVATLNMYNLTKDLYVIIAFLTCNIIVKLCFSSNPWESLMFWLLLGIILNNTSKLRKIRLK